jgi:hypothetical protein
VQLNLSSPFKVCVNNDFFLYNKLNVILLIYVKLFFWDANSPKLVVTITKFWQVDSSQSLRTHTSSWEATSFQKSNILFKFVSKLECQDLVEVIGWLLNAINQACLIQDARVPFLGHPCVWSNHPLGLRRLC